MTTILGDGTVVTGGNAPAVLPGHGVAWDDGSIAAVADMATLRSRYPRAEIVEARGGLIVPGFVNLHHHFYSALARGLDPGVSPQGFGDVLESLWWRLDRSLDLDAVRISARLTLADCIRWGCTTVFDHHSSPHCIAGSLDAIASEVETAGLTAVLCYETSDRNGPDGAIDGIDENVDFCTRHADHPSIRGIMGLHASFTVTDETLETTARRRPDGVGVHLHVAEDQLDIRVSNALYGAGPVERLSRAGLLDSRALLAHGVHLGTDELDRVADADAILIHNPESNANNGVGRLDVVAARRAGCEVALGTDGMGSSMLAAARAAFLTHRAARRDPRVGFEVHPTLLASTAASAGRILGEPRLGELAPGAPADIAVVDAPPPTPANPDNLFGHLIYGAACAVVRHTVAHGRFLMRDFELTTIDVQEATATAREIAPRIWERFRAFPVPSSR